MSSDAGTTGNCLCGAVKFEIKFPTDMFSHCHCESCRRAHGAAFVTWTGVRSSQFKFVSGEDKLRAFESRPGTRWKFCSDCGSSLLYDSDAAPGRVYMTVANLNGAIDRAPEGHVSFEERVEWLHVNDGLPRFRAKTDEQI
jgi:hypothetical protein